MKLARLLPFPALVCALPFPAAWAQYGSAEREFVASNGRTVRISALGNLAAFQSAPGLEDLAVKTDRPSREGYVLAYRTGSAGPLRTIYNVHDSASQTIVPGSPDFVVESFTAPVGYVFPCESSMKAVSVVHTRDGAIRLTQVFDWNACYGPMRISMTVTALRDVTFYALKREGDYDVAQRLLNDVVQKSNGAAFLGYACVPALECPPRCPPGDPDCRPTIGLRSVSVFGNPAPTYVSVRPSSDNGEHTSPYPPVVSLPGFRMGEDNQVSLGWTAPRSMRPGDHADANVSIGAM